jgi:hypothetical protein
MRQRTTIIATFCGILPLLLLTAVVPGAVTAQSEYELSTTDSTDIPTREITIRGATYEFSTLGSVETGGSVDLSISAPSDDQFYRVYLYNSSETPVIRESGTGNSTITFNLGDQNPGTYAFALQERGTTVAAYPLVIKGYELNLNTSDQVPAGDSLIANISLTQTEPNVTTDRVEIVVAGQDSQLTETASQDNNSYVATVSTDPLAEGSYLMYANVRGTNTVFNEQEILGVSKSNTITVGDSGSSGGGSSDDGSSGGGSSGGGSSGGGSSGGGSSGGGSSDDGTEPSGQIEDPEEQEELPEPGSESDTNNQSTNQGDQTETETQSDSSSSIPGFTPEVAVTAVLLITLLMRVKHG